MSVAVIFLMKVDCHGYRFFTYIKRENNKLYIKPYLKG